MEPETTHQSKESLAHRIAEWAMLAVIFLVPLFFIPSQVVVFQFTKALLLYVAILVAFCAFIVARLKDGVMRVPKSWLYPALALIPLTYALSALLSPTRKTSIIGNGFEIGSLSFVIATSLLAFFVSYFFHSKRAALYSYLAFLIPVPIVALFQFGRLVFGPRFMTLGVFGSETSTLLGGWNDLGIYFGAAALFAFISLELLKLDGWIKWAFRAVLVISLLFLTVINFSAVWYILAIFALIFFVYNFSFNKSKAFDMSPVHSGDARRSVPVVSLIVLIISVIFILIQGNLYSSLSQLTGIDFLNRFAVSNIEVRPSWTTTFQVAKDAIIRHPVFGAGPNRFVNEWLMSKPDVINQTIFWGTDFNYGIGLIPTLVVTTGTVGTLAWIIFFGFFLYMGFRALFFRTQDTFLSYLSVSSFIIALYLWLFSFVYVPSPALIILTFFFTGLFMASLIENGITKVYSFNFVRDPRKSFVSVLVFIVVLLGLLVSSYAIGRKFVASVYFNKALVSANVEGNIDAAENNLLNAIRLDQNTQYYRTLADLYLVRMNVLLSQQNVSQEVLQNQFRSHLGNAQAAAQAAVNADKTDYQNWLQLGRVYESVVPLNVEGAYESAQTAYAEAQKLNPKSPAIQLVIARLDVAHKDIPKAKEHVTEALKMKNDYTDAIFFLAQIQINEGDIKSAIQSTEAAAYLNPNNSGVYFQLGLLRYEDKNYEGAASAFEQAIALTPDYANAKYFLGLSYAQTDRTEEAITQFQNIVATNPDNQEVQAILTNLQAGKEPFAGISAPNNEPESRSTPPVKETTKPADTSDR